MRNNYHYEEFERGERRPRRDEAHREEEHGRRRDESHHREELERGEHGRHREKSRYHTSRRSTDEDGVGGKERRERVGRGMLRYLLLDALHSGPKHGYEIIKWLEEKTYGRYTPSAGTVYPTLQLLEDQGLILAERSDEKSVYRLTEAGETELQNHADFTQEFWERNGHPVPSPATLLAVEFVYEELQDLQHTVEKGVSVLTQYNDQQSLLPLRQVIERSKNEIRDLLSGGSAPQQRSAREAREANELNELEAVIAQLFVSEDEALRQTVVRAREQGLPPIQISALQGKLLQVLATACQARKILEIGALAGYSGIWLARALPADGRLITLEIDAKHADMVRESFRQAHVDDRAEVRIGPALEALPLLTTEGSFDLIFIDADKGPYPQYLEWAIKLARPGSIIVADNCVLEGDGLSTEESTNPRTAGIRAYNRNASTNPVLRSIALPINSGMTISVVLADAEQRQA